MNEPTQRVIRLFEAALELPLEEQSQFLANECAGQPRTLAEVKSLLAAHDEAEAESFMRQPALQIQAHQIASELAETRSGQTIGRYQLLELIGEGGMGEVYLAQDQELDRKVAVKLIKGNFKTQELLRRFNNERQILAHLNHANIASLLDGGTTDDGVPFFVMEHVEGQPIDRYADEHQLSTIDRLKLFRTVCVAVQYAHQNLIIHRDLKPTNILVTSEGDPKLLDFGIAKLLVADDSGATDETAAMFRVMTPEYASPEQVKGEPITTATDVYSLGVVLYELLTGQRPHKFRSRQPADIAEAICIKEPEKPSQAVGRGEGEKGRQGESVTGDEISFSPSPRRPVPPSQLRGDLDNIVLMAMRKEPQRRYSSVGEFSEDIRRHLEALPVRARQDTFKYRASKFIKRNKIAVAAAAVIALTLIGGIVATTWEARVARIERARAEQRFNQVRKLAHSFLFDYHDSIAALPGSTQVREKLVKDSLEYLDSLAKEAGNDISLQRELATAYAKVGDVQGGASTPVGGLTISASNLGDTAGALESHRKALAIRDRLAALEPSNKELRRELLSSYTRLADLYITLGQPGTAVDYFRKATLISEGLSAADPTNETLRLELDQVYFAMGKALGGPSTANVGDTKGASEYLRKALAIDEELAAKHPADVKYRQSLAASYNALGLMLFNSGKQTEALENYRKAVAIDEALVKDDGNNAFYRRELAVQYGNFGSTLLAIGDKAGALENFRHAQSLYEALVAADQNDVNIRRNAAVGYRNIGAALGGNGDRTGALENFRKALQLFQQLVAKDPNNADFRRQQGLTYLKISTFMSDTGDVLGALSNAQQAKTLDEALVAAAPKNIVARSNLALIYSQLGKVHAVIASKTGTPVKQQIEHWREARDWYQKSFDIYQDMKSKGTLSGADANKPEELAREIAKCDEALKRVPGQ
jgi:non-specific serine/threonine protein kinase/serine/threonine-protein kinase